MAVHPSLDTMAIEAIEEYLAVSAHCLSSVKQDGGCYGYPATLLLFCVTNALGVYLAGESVTVGQHSQQIREKKPFRVFNHECFGLALDEEEIRRLEVAYRNRLAHNAFIDIGAGLVADPSGPPFAFTPDQIKINVVSFHALVTKAWERFPRERIEAWAKRHKNTPKRS